MAKNGLTNMAMELFEKLAGLSRGVLITIGIILLFYIVLIFFVYFQITQPITDNIFFIFIQKIAGIGVIFLMIFFPFKLGYIFLQQLMDKKLPATTTSQSPAVLSQNGTNARGVTTQNTDSTSLLDGIKKMLGRILMILFFIFVIVLLKNIFTSNKVQLNEGIFPVLKKTFFGENTTNSSSKKSSKQKSISSSQKIYQVSPNVKYRQDSRTERDRLYYENLEKKWEYEEKIKSIEQKNETNNTNGKFSIDQMMPHSSLNYQNSNPNFSWDEYNEKYQPLDQSAQMKPL